ncbi:MAG: TIGR02452 family protein [Oscillospiraceae bacterium]|nr:TIGR02452 family protein [Oscillospiraceae bacterium]
MDKKSSREDRIAIFIDTQNWIMDNEELSAAVRDAQNNTEVFFEDDYPGFSSFRIKKTSISVSKERSFQAAIRLSEEYPKAKIAVLNFANAFCPGGGVKDGSGAQEESLCRISTLYPVLWRKTLRDTFYQHHVLMNNPKASDALIYSEGIVICKTDDAFPERMPREDWKVVDVITMAAPDLRHKGNKFASLVGAGAVMNSAELFGYHVKRAIHMLTVAAAKKVDILVLGAFGCGAFNNSPVVVAEAYQTALNIFPNMFDHIQFAVYCTPADIKNFETFSRTFR